MRISICGSSLADPPDAQASAMPDFTAFDHPVLALDCPDCGCPAGVRCEGLSSDLLADFHLGRKNLVGEAFIRQHGDQAGLRKVGGQWVISHYQSDPVLAKTA